MMPIQFVAWERRDSADRTALAEKTLELCRIIKNRKGIRSCRFYWQGTDTIVMLTEGEAKALDDSTLADLSDAARKAYYRVGFDIADMAREIQSWRLNEPRFGEETYRAAGRLK